ncbi:alveolysin, partial [Bacillus toyonensis]
MKTTRNTKGKKLLASLIISFCTINYSSISLAETPKSNSANAPKQAIDIDTGIANLK